MKEQASEIFKKGDYKEAIKIFTDCLTLDEYNIHFNATVNLNIALGLIKQNKPEDALTHLNKAVAMNPKYVKAIVKRGQVNQ